MPFRINRVYTRAGDRGETGLADGSRVSKADLRIALAGDIDELNCLLGAAKEELDVCTAELRPVIEELQQELFDLGAEAATPGAAVLDESLRMSIARVGHLEDLCDRYNAGLPELTSFIVPGGSRLAAQLHLGRAVARRAERTMVHWLESTGRAGENPAMLSYLNRCSDLLFILARWVLIQQGAESLLWVPANQRSS